eukprot:gene4877-9724_t
MESTVDDELGSFLAELNEIESTAISSPDEVLHVDKRPKLVEMVVSKPQVICKAPEIIEVVAPEIRIPEKSTNHSSSDKSNWAEYSAFETAPSFSYGDSYPTMPMKPPPPTSNPPVPSTQPVVPQQNKKFVRKGADEVWIDDSLNEWPENDFRLFVGDLGIEVNTEMLAKEFQSFKSFTKAKVIRDKVNFKSRGYGFVSFMDPFEAAKAIREKNGKYLGNRPMKISKSTWKDRDIKE